MNTNFFQEIAALQVQGGFKINISPTKNDQWIVSILYFDDGIGDDARKRVPPMCLRGTPQELDEGFFAHISQPVKETAGLFTNMEQFLRERENAKRASQMEKDGQDKERKEKEERKKKFEAAMKKVDEMDEAKKYQEAISCLPKADQFPEQAETIKKRLDELRKKNGQISIFETE